MEWFKEAQNHLLKEKWRNCKEKLRATKKFLEQVLVRWCRSNLQEVNFSMKAPHLQWICQQTCKNSSKRLPKIKKSFKNVIVSSGVGTEQLVKLARSLNIKWRVISKSLSKKSKFSKNLCIRRGTSLLIFRQLSWPFDTIRKPIIQMISRYCLEIF